MWTPIIGEDTGIVLGQAFLKALGDKRELPVLVILYCRWTMHWCLLLLIFRDACIFAYDAELKAQRRYDGDGSGERVLYGISKRCTDESAH